MLTDLIKTLKDVFGWIPTVLPEGIKMALIVILAAVVIGCFIPVLGFILFCLAIFCAFFFRNPERNAVFAADEIACPADGTVLSIQTEDDPNTIVVRIFLSVFNVHVQRATMNGKVEDVVYTPGIFAFANADEAKNNERNLIKLSKNFKFAHIEQITGAIARRIVCWVKPGQEVKVGELVGLIRFGSQVAIYMPKDAVRVIVKPGQKVEGGNTVIALWHKAP